MTSRTSAASISYVITRVTHAYVIRAVAMGNGVRAVGIGGTRVACHALRACGVRRVVAIETRSALTHAIDTVGISDAILTLGVVNTGVAKETK